MVEGDSRGGRVSFSVAAAAPDNCCCVHHTDITCVELSTVCLANDKLQLLKAHKPWQVYCPINTMEVMEVCSSFLSLARMIATIHTTAMSGGGGLCPDGSDSVSDELWPGVDDLLTCFGVSEKKSLTNYTRSVARARSVIAKLILGGVKY